MSHLRYLLLGAGDLAREVAQILSSTSGPLLEVAVFCDIPSALSPDFTRSCATTAEALEHFPPTLWKAVVCVGSPAGRASLYESFHALGYTFATVIHPEATVLAAHIGEGSIIFAGARIAIGCHLAYNTVVNYNATIGHDTHVGAHGVVSPGVQLGGRIHAGAGVLFGIGSSVLPKRKLGDYSVVSAGSAIWTDVAPGVTMVGVPAVPRKMPGRSPITSPKS